MKALSFLLFILFLGNNISAQSNDTVVRPLVIEEVTKAMSKGTQPAFKINVYEATKKGTADALTKAMKEENKAKLELKGNEYTVPAVIVKSISQKPLNVYVIINEYEDHVEVFFFYEQDSVFLTKEKNETEYLSARKATYDFAVKAYKGAVQEHIDAEQKKLKQYEDEFDDIVKENDKLHKKIDEGNRDIEKARDNIATSELDQERTRKSIQDEKAELGRLKTGGSPEVVKEVEKKLKDTEGDLSKLQKQEDGWRKDINNSEADIRDYERKISDNEAAMKQKQDEIAKQKDYIHKLQKKLESIK